MNDVFDMFNEILEKDETNEVSQYFKTQVNLYSEVVDSDLENVFGGKFVEKGNKLLCPSLTNASHVMACLSRRSASLTCLSRGQQPSVACLSRDACFAVGVNAYGDEVTLRVHSGLGGTQPVYSFSASLWHRLEDLRDLVERVTMIPLREQRIVVGCHELCCRTGSPGDPYGPGTLGTALQDIGANPVPGATIDLLVIRVDSSWAALIEDVRLGRAPLEGLGEDARSHREVVLAAVEQDADALRHASEEFRGDKAVVIAAVRKSGHCLKYATAELQADREVVLAAVSNHWRALAFAAPELKSDRDFMLEAVRAHGSALQYASPELQRDRTVVLEAVERSGWALSCASEELRGDHACVWAAVQNNPAALDFAVQPLQTNPDLVLLASSGSGRRVVAPCGQEPRCCVS